MRPPHADNQRHRALSSSGYVTFQFLAVPNMLHVLRAGCVTLFILILIPLHLFLKAASSDIVRTPHEAWMSPGTTPGLD
jgi:hypothetical protein